jgi:hypothetical protein
MEKQNASLRSIVGMPEAAGVGTITEQQWTSCHHSTPRYRTADGEDGLQI